MNKDTWQLIDSVPGWMGKDECAWLADEAGRAVSWTEVGVWCGRSLLAVALHLPQGALLQAVDVLFDDAVLNSTQPEVLQQWMHYWKDLDLNIPREHLSRTLALIRQRRPDIELVIYPLPSVQASYATANTDVCFLDAGHSYEDVSADIVAWRNKCRVLCGHDYQPNWAGVMRAVDEAFSEASNPVGAIWRAAC